MSRIKWDEIGTRFFETGLDHGVLFIRDEDGYRNGVPWNGLVSVTETSSGADANPMYADDIKYLNLIAAEDFGATIEAYTYPDEWSECEGFADISTGATIGQQLRKTFGLSYQTRKGNDVAGTDYGYKIHLVYGVLASPSDRGYQSINDNPDAITFSWTVTTTPLNVPGKKPTAHLVIDSVKTDPQILSMLEDLIYGREASSGKDAIDSRLPTPEAVLYILAHGTLYQENDEPLLDSSGNPILDHTNAAIQACHMTLVA